MYTDSEASGQMNRPRMQFLYISVLYNRADRPGMELVQSLGPSHSRQASTKVASEVGLNGKATYYTHCLLSVS